MRRPGLVLLTATLACFLFFGLVGALPAAAAAKILIAPTRIVLEGGQRSASIHVANQGDGPANLRVLVVNKRMLESGLIVDVEVPEPDELFAKGMIRYSPRRVVIPAGGNQTVRLVLRGKRPADGEYRSHLVFRSVPAELPASSDDDEANITVRARAIVETSIPVIVRWGDLDASIRFSEKDVHLDRAAGALPTLTLRLERAGSRSVYGDLEVEYVEPDGSVHQLAYMGGLAVYQPTPGRTLRVGLRLPDGVRLDSGKLRASFRERDHAKSALEAEISIPLD